MWLTSTQKSERQSLSAFHYACFHSLYIMDKARKAQTVLKITSFSLLVYYVYILEIKVSQPKRFVTVSLCSFQLSQPDLFPLPLGYTPCSKPRARNSTGDGQASSSTLAILNKLLTFCMTHLLNVKRKCTSQNSSLLVRNANTLKHFENTGCQKNVYY